MAARRPLGLGFLAAALLVVVSTGGWLPRASPPTFLSASGPVWRASRSNLVMRRLRLQGQEIPRNQAISRAMPAAIYGVGRTTAYKVCQDCAIDPEKRTVNLSADEELRLSEELGKYTLENPLKRMYKANCKLLVEIKHMRGVRMKKGLPVRYQRSKTNNRNSRKLNPMRP